MRLTELNPKFLASFDAGGSKTLGMGVSFACPCGRHEDAHRLYVPFANPIGPGPLASVVDQRGWTRSGETFETLTLTPSILRVEKREEDGIGCGWHGFITNGEVRTV